jgi:hypothetical protein
MASYVNTQPGSITHSNFGPAPGSNEGVQGPVTIRTMRNDSTDCAFVANLGVEAFREKFIHATSVNRYGMIYFRDRLCNLNFFLSGHRVIKNWGRWKLQILYSLFRGDVTSSNNNESAIFRRWKSNVKWRMFHRLNDKGDNSLTEIPGCPEKRIVSSGF